MSSVADFDVDDFESREAADKSVFPHFYIKARLNPSKSDEAGRPIYEDTEYVKIITPGNATNTPDRPVTDDDRKRFRRQYRMFKEGKQDEVVGTPLSEAPWITRSQVEELAYFKIKSLEQLAVVNDDVCTRIPGLFKLKQRAQHVIEKAEKSVPFITLQKQNDELAGRLAAMEQAMQDQAKIIADMKKK